MGCLGSKHLKILVLLGSARKKSANAGLVNELVKFPINSKHEVQLVVLRLDNIPIYNEDEQAKGGTNIYDSLSQEVVNLRNHAQSAKAILFVTPQINGSISPLILNSFVWLSRFHDGKKKPLLLAKKAGVISASYLSQNQIIDCLQIGQSLDMNMFSETFHVSLGEKGINEQGKVVSSALVGKLQAWYKSFIEFILKK